MTAVPRGRLEAEKVFGNSIALGHSEQGAILHLELAESTAAAR